MGMKSQDRSVGIVADDDQEYPKHESLIFITSDSSIQWL